jgi:surface antigen
MKKFIAALIIVGLSVSVASADWLGEFKKSYQEKNLDIAVEKAYKGGVSPDDITKNSLDIATVNPQNLVKALYCAGVTGQDVYTACQNNNISELILAAGFKKSKEECGDMVTDTQPYTPGGAQGRGFGGANRGQRGKPYASPSGF